MCGNYYKLSDKTAWDLKKGQHLNGGFCGPIANEMRFKCSTIKKTSIPLLNLNDKRVKSIINKLDERGLTVLLLIVFFFYNFILFIYDLILGMYFQSSPSPSLYLEIPMT